MQECKRCAECSSNLPANATNFYKLSGRPWLENVCKMCRKARITEKRKSEHRREYDKRYRIEHRKPPKIRIPRQRKIKEPTAPKIRDKLCRKCLTKKPATTDFFRHLSGSTTAFSRHCIVCATEHADAKAAAKLKRHLRLLEKSARRAIRLRRPEIETEEQKADRLAKKRAHNRKYHARLLVRRREKYRSDPSYRLRINVARAMRKQLANGKGRKRWQDAVGYTVEALRAHLERQFTARMSWGNHGVHGWHVDHIVPIASFGPMEFGDATFRACWALSNLRPMWAEKNREKKDKRELLL